MLKFKLKHPVVLIHGLGAKKGFGPLNYFYRMKPLLESWGNRVHIANLALWHSSEFRCEQLGSEILKHFPDEPVNLFGHSMGGIDARLLATKADFKNRIKSITTLGTPNHGCSIVDLALDRFEFIRAQNINKILASINLKNMNHLGFEQLSTKHLKGENGSTITDVPEVSYYSVAGAIADPVLKNALPVFWSTHKILKEMEGDNDGFVSVKSATHGNMIGVYPLDHYRQIGHFMSNKGRQIYYQMLADIFQRLSNEGH